MLEYIFAILEWCKVVAFLYGKNEKKLFKEGEVWWCSIGMNVGVEVYGKGVKFERPILIIKKFHATLFLGIPLTTKIKQGSWYKTVDINNSNVVAIYNQVRTLDVKRLTERMGTLSEKQFSEIKSSFLDFLSDPINVRPSLEGEGTVGNPKDTL